MPTLLHLYAFQFVVWGQSNALHTLLCHVAVWLQGSLFWIGRQVSDEAFVHNIDQEVFNELLTVSN
jgi:hypothetical protein